MIRKTAVLPVLMPCLALLLVAEAPCEQNPPGEPQATAASAPQVPKKQELGAWWEKNAMKLKPLPTRWLFHADGTFSYSNNSGNTGGSTIDSTVNLEVRKNRITNHLFGQWSHRDIVAANQGSVNYVERMLREQVDFDPTESITFFAAIEDYRNTLMFIDRRLLVYAGMGGRVFHNEKSEVILNGGLGFADFTFDRAQLLRINPAQIAGLDTSPSSGGAIGTQTWRWKVSTRFSFTEDVTYMKYFTSYLGDRWTVNLVGNFPINKRFSFNVTYRLKDENNALIKALGVFPRDRAFLMGIKVSI